MIPCLLTLINQAELYSTFGDIRNLGEKVQSSILKLEMKSLRLFCVESEKQQNWHKQHDFKMYAKY